MFRRTKIVLGLLTGLSLAGMVQPSSTMGASWSASQDQQLQQPGPATPAPQPITLGRGGNWKPYPPNNNNNNNNNNGPSIDDQRADLKRQITANQQYADQLLKQIADIANQIKLATKNASDASSKLDDANKALTDATAQLNDAIKANDAAKKAFNDTIKKLTQAWEQSPAILALIRTAEDARVTCDQLAISIVAEVMKTSEYKQIVAEIKQAKAEFDAMQASGDATQQVRAAKAQALLDAQTRLANLEQAALEANPDWAKSHQVYTKAQTELATQRANFMLGLKNDPDYAAAQAACVKAADDLSKCRMAVGAATSARDTATNTVARAKTQSDQLEANSKKLEDQRASILNQIDTLQKRLASLH